jgi:dolichol kinase
VIIILTLKKHLHNRYFIRNNWPKRILYDKLQFIMSENIWRMVSQLLQNWENCYNIWLWLGKRL